MSNSNAKTNNVSGFRIAVMIISILVLSLIMAFSIILGISSFKRNGPISMGNDATTVRKVVPNDGTLPTDAEAIDNIGYMAYVMDHQEFYHSYAYNSTKSTGYEQVTQSWKDYKSADISGEGRSIMVSSDLSYSSLIKSSTQSCFLGSDKAIIRSGSKPSSTKTTPLDIEWASGIPDIYDKEGYKYVYGEFSTEISVYVINENTLAGADPVVVNDDGTYSQKYYLNENAGVWYQYGMKTRGGLKNYPEFKKIEITFTFDENWRIIQSYCEEKATISPRALGGMGMASDSKTTTTFDYTLEGLDDAHFSYFNGFFKQYQDAAPGVNASSGETGVLDVLGGGFSKVVSESGQQFKLELTLGETVYDGRVYLKLADLSDPLGSIDARVELEKKGSGKQDFYAEFKNSKINVYYSTGFALTADLDSMSTAVNNIADWVGKMTSQPKQTVRYSLTAEEASGGLDLGSLLNALKLEIKETEAVISLKSENLLGLGLGIDVAITFDRIVEEDGDLFAIKGVGLNYIDYNGEPVDLKIAIVPDDSGAEIISRQEQAGTNLADYVNSVYKILNSKTIKVDIGLDDKLIDGLSLDATAYLSIGSDIAANVSVSALYEGISLKLDASYIYDNSAYGKIYLHVTEINGTAVDAKVYSDIGDTVSAVESIIAIFNGNQKSATDGVKVTAEAEESLVAIINKVLNLNFSKIIGNIESTTSTISLDINVDELLKGLDVSLGFDFGKVALTLDSANNTISGNLEDLGLAIVIGGSDADLPLISNPEEYLDLTLVVQLTEDIINEGKKIAEAEDIVFSADAEVGVAASVHAEGEVVWAGDAVKVGVTATITADNEQKLAINFVYDDTVNSDEPLVIITLNELGTTISVDEIDKLVDTFAGLIGVFNNTSTAAYNTAAPVVPYGNGIEVGGKSLGEILKNGNVQSAIKAILSFANEFAVELKTVDAEKAIYNLIVSHSDGLKITLGANGGLSLGLAKAGEFSLAARVEAGNGTTVSALRGELLDNADGDIEFLELSDFVERVYKGFFEDIEAGSLKDVLGDNPYSVTLSLSGKNSAIKELEGVDIKAELYYDEGLVGTSRTTKLLHAKLDLNINGTPVNATAAYHGNMLYIELNKVGTTTLRGIKVKADVNDIYDVVEQLVRLVTDTDLVDTIGKFMGNSAVSAEDGENIAAFASMTGKNGTPAPSTLTKLLNALLTLNFEQAFKYDKATHTAEINVDSISEALLGVKIGTVKVLADIDNKTIAASVKLEGKDAWLTLNAAPCAFKADIINPDDYMDIGFLSTLISDVRNTATNGGNHIGTMYTLTGTIDVKFIGTSLLSITLKNTKLSAGLDENGKFYASLTASVDSLLLNNSNISFTYADGLIVLGRDIDKDNAEYRVLTIEYLLDNLVSGDAILKWYLGAEGLAWTIISSVKDLKNLNSGLTTPQTYVLYEELAKNAAEEKFALIDYLSGLDVRTDGGYSSSFGNASNALKELGLNNDNNHYVAELNAEALTGGTLTKLYAALLRDNDRLSGIKAYGAIKSYVNFNVNLESISSTDVGDSESDVTVVPNFLDFVTENYNFDRNKTFKRSDEQKKNHTTPIFGCFNTAKEEEERYSTSDILETIYLDVYGLSDGKSERKLEKTIEVEYSSEVLLVSDFPEFAGDGQKLYYTNADGVDLKKSITINESIVVYDVDGKGRVSVYKASEDAVEVVFHFVNISDMDPVSAAYAYDEELVEYPLNDYTFLGWYTSKDFTATTKIDKVNIKSGTLTVYGRYAKDIVEKENGVIYTFDKDITAYYVSGRDDEVKIDANAWLEIASDIDGYPVTYIKAGAFKRGDDTTDLKIANSLVNVLVPESVTAVYESAFHDNKGLRNVVFLADEVFFGGKISDKNTVFYGCYPSDSPSSNNNNFNLYYNSTAANTAGDWNGIYYNKPLLSSATIYYMKSWKSGWNIVDYTFITDGIDSEVADYINSLNLFTSGIHDENAREYTAENIRNILLENINAFTCQDDHGRFIDGYDVSVTIKGNSTEKTVFGKYSEVTIEIIKLSNPKYMVNSHTVPDERAAYVSGLKEYNGNYYATAGEKYYIVINEGYEFISVSGVSVVEEDGEYYFIMPSAFTEIDIVCNKLAVTKITLISDISFTYEGTLYDTLDGGKYKAEIGVPEESLLAPTADSNYTFVGWAYSVGDSSYVFGGSEIDSHVYYAVWAYKRDGIDTLTASNLTLTATVDSSKANSVYGWYADNNFSGDALALCNDSNSATFTTVTSTILHARLYFTLTVAVSGSSCKEVEVKNTDGSTMTKSSSATSKALNISAQIAVLEGDIIYIKDRNNPATQKDYRIIAEHDGEYREITGDINIRTGITNKATEIYAYDDNGRISIDQTDSDGYKCSSGYTVSGNFTFTFKNS